MEVFMKGKRGRDAGSGRIIPVSKAIAMGDRAVVETVKKPTTRK
jgi:hypothetical protein